MGFVVTFEFLSEPCSEEVESLDSALSVAIEVEMDGASGIRIRDQATGYEDGLWTFAKAHGIDLIEFAKKNELELAQWVELPNA